MPTRNGSSSGAALLLKRFESPTASRDRRISHEAGGSNQLREGFERVRNEMEGAARDMRRERAERGLSVEGDVDWTFWGAVVQDYEEVAQSRPKDLSRAIQRGIPAVIRGPIWQLMSSSKSSELEETYKALLKMTSPHEKAIQKDITRTFPNHKFFQGVGAGQDGLFMVVKAYSLYDQEVGYTQGVAFIVAALLLNVSHTTALSLTSDARRRSVLRSCASHGLVQPAITLPRRHARSPTPTVPVRPTSRGHITITPQPSRPQGHQELHVRQPVVHDTLLLPFPALSRL